MKDAADSGGGPMSQLAFGATTTDRSYAIATFGDSSNMPADLKADIVQATDGDLLEVLAIHGDWAYVRLFQEKQDVVNQGVAPLDWLHGVYLTWEDGRRKCVEANLRSPSYGLAKPKDAAGQLKLKIYRRKLEDAARKMEQHVANKGQVQTKKVHIDSIHDEELAAAQAAAELEKEDEKRKSKKSKQQTKRQAAKRQVEDEASARQHALADVVCEATDKRTVDAGKGGLSASALVEPTPSAPAATAAQVNGLASDSKNVRLVQGARESACLLSGKQTRSQSVPKQGRSRSVPKQAKQRQPSEHRRNVDTPEVAEARRRVENARKRAADAEERVRRVVLEAAEARKKVRQAEEELHRLVAASEVGRGAPRLEAEPERPGGSSAWEAQWEQQAARLERMLSGPPSGVPASAECDLNAPRHPRPMTAQRKVALRAFASRLLDAKRSGELHELAAEYESLYSVCVADLGL